MKTSETLYAAAAYMRKHGFSPYWNPHGNCGCFGHATITVGGYANAEFAMDYVYRVIDCTVHPDDLTRHGWTTKRDAVAALEIAADIAAAEGN